MQHNLKLDHVMKFLYKTACRFLSQVSQAPILPAKEGEGYIANKFYANRSFPYPRQLRYRIPGKEINYMSPEEAVSFVRTGDNVYIQSVAAAPQTLIQALSSVVENSDRKQISLYHILIDGELPIFTPNFSGKITSNSLFIGGNCRKHVNEGIADYTPMLLLFSVDITLSALEVARERIAVVNPFMPRTLGDALVHISQLDHLVYEEKPLPELNVPKEDPCPCLQTGIGAIPDAILKYLRHHKDLGVHTEMFSDGLIELVENGNVTNELKKIEPGKIISSFLLGTSRLYRFVDNNPLVCMRDVTFTNDPGVIGKNDNVVAVNAAIEVDLTGQICSDSIGESFYSGFGGQVDFMRGAALSENGKAIIALPSTGGRRHSRIVPIIKPGGGVVTTRAHAHYVVTEYGIAELKGKSIRERAKALINIAHPDFREQLEQEAKRRSLF
ncbi:4-hydroxybutyrate coenzyme A transferase [Galdieria sulphuraria]|nr:4-hydroxybutyrate coenzyme A transferase [Galdieria sulphuraria]